MRKLLIACTDISRERATSFPGPLSVVEREVEGPGKGWLSHEQIFQHIWKIYYRN